MRRVEAFLQFLRSVKMDGKRNWQTLAGACQGRCWEFPNRACGHHRTSRMKIADFEPAIVQTEMLMTRHKKEANPRAVKLNLTLD
jgi:hypothetical protein